MMPIRKRGMALVKPLISSSFFLLRIDFILPQKSLEILSFENSYVLIQIIIQ